MHESDAFAVHIAALPALAEHARALLREAGSSRGDIVHVEAEMMDAAARISFEEFRHRRIRPRRLHQLDLGGAEIDVGEAHALLLVEHALAHDQSISVGERACGGVDVGHDDRHVSKTDSHPVLQLSGITNQ